MKILLTGGCGFIGSAVVRYLINHTDHKVLNVDKLTYAGDLGSVASVADFDRYKFSQTDICDRTELDRLFHEFKPDLVMHLAAESHVDRSIDNAENFIQTNIVGTYQLLEATRFYWQGLPQKLQTSFRFHHISTDEVYGDLKCTKDLFTELTAYAPSSPYSASKASADHLVRSWHRTYGLPVVLTNCSNNYGPYHFPEKFIPQMIISALLGRSLPVYGTGNQVRDWLYVEDHARALVLVAMKGRLGEAYNIGGHNEKRNIDVVHALCNLLEDLVPAKPTGLKRYSQLIEFVEDRPGHDKRYAIDASKIQSELGWVPSETFESGLSKTVEWYLANQEWWSRILRADYQLGRVGRIN